MAMRRYMDPNTGEVYFADDGQDILNRGLNRYEPFNDQGGDQSGSGHDEGDGGDGGGGGGGGGDSGGQHDPRTGGGDKSGAGGHGGGGVDTSGLGNINQKDNGEPPPTSGGGSSGGGGKSLSNPNDRDQIIAQNRGQAYHDPNGKTYHIANDGAILEELDPSKQFEQTKNTPPGKDPGDYWLEQRNAAYNQQHPEAGKAGTPAPVGKGGPGTAPPGGASGGASGGGAKGFNPDAAKVAEQAAKDAAYQAYLNEKLKQVDIPTMNNQDRQTADRLAFDKAAEVFKEEIAKAGISGYTSDGKPTTQWLAQLAAMTGMYQGLPTEQRRQFDQQFGLSEAGVTGTYRGAPTQAAKEFDINTQFRQAEADRGYGLNVGGLTGYFGGAPTLARDTLSETVRNDQFNNYLAEGGLTGYYQGAPTLERQRIEEDFAQRQAEAEAQYVGYYNGQETMARTQMVSDLTGMYQNAPTWQRQYQTAGLTGYLDNQATLARQQFEAAATGMYNGAPTEQRQEFLTQAGGYMPTGEATLAREAQDAAISGYYGPAEQKKATLAREQEENQTALGVMGIAENLRGPENAFQQLRVLGGMSNGLRDTLDAAAGRFNLPGYGAGADPSTLRAATLQGLFNTIQNPGQYAAEMGMRPTAAPAPTTIPGDVASQPQDWQTAYNQALQNYLNGQQQAAAGGATPQYGGAGANTVLDPATANLGQAVGSLPTGQGVGGANVTPPGYQAPQTHYNYQPTGTGGYTTYPPGIQAPTDAGQINTPTPRSTAELQAMGLDQAAQQGPGLLPSQLNARNMARMGTYGQKMVFGGFENTGWDVNAARDVYLASLPQYGGAQHGSLAGIV